MPASLLAGKPVAEAVLTDVTQRAQRLREGGIVPTLATVLVGDDEASAGYVRKKHETCQSVGIGSLDERLPEGTTQEQLEAVLTRLNADGSVHGIIVQSPLPRGLDFNAALMRLDPRKDADGLHPQSMGCLALGAAAPVPATPAGIDAMFRHYGVEVAGKHVVIVGRGPTLGRPLSLLLGASRPGGNAAVTVVHSRIEGWQRFTQQADIVVVGVGRPSVLMPEMVRPGAVVVSAGITWRGKRLVPDVDESVGEVAGWITPRLGGVGVTTVALLLRNTVSLAEAAQA